MANDVLHGRENGVGVDVVWGYVATFCSMLLFAGINGVLIRYNPLASTVTKDSWRWRNLFISMLHSFVCSVWNLTCFFLFPDQFADLIDDGNAFMYFLVVFVTGYFTYDFLDIIINKKLMQTWEVLVHHFAVLIIFWHNMHTRTCIPYSLIALLTEVNTVFLHARKLYQIKLKDTDHWTYRLLATVNIVTFAVFRGFPLGWITYGLLDMEQNIKVSTWYYRSLWLSMSIMITINPIFFWKLLQSDFLKKKKKRPLNKITTNGNNNIKME